MTNNLQRTPEEIQQDFHDKLSQALNPTATHFQPETMDLKRYRQVRRFFARAFIHVIWWDIILNRPILARFRTAPLPRWQKIARRYRALAVEMGGVLIKLGQFLSIRVDVLPAEVTRELAGLQDEIPPESPPAILAQIEADFGCSVTDLFDWFSPEPLGAASLAQVHQARLTSGEEVVVKVLRPNINILVETDLAAIALAIRWLKWYRRISKWVDLNRLADEFTRVTRQELDLKAEGQNAERFAQDFADDPQIYVPKVYWGYSAARTLTLENVSYIKIGDLQGIEAAGISRPEVARKFYGALMEQCFVTNFVHADPHPGNVFVKPLPHPDELAHTVFRPGAPVPYRPDRPFQLVFIDFGMMVTIPERLRAALREYAIGMGTRDARRVVKSYLDIGALLPGADIPRLEAATADMFQRFWGVRMGQVREVAFSEAQYFFQEYRDLVYEAPFQFPVDLLFVGRAIGILSGMSTNLDPEFDPWSEIIPFAERLARQELERNWRGWLQELVAIGQLTLQLPKRVDKVLMEVERGALTVQTSLAPDTRKALRGMEQSINRLSWMVVAMGLLVAGAILYEASLGIWLMGLAGLAFLLALLRTK